MPENDPPVEQLDPDPQELADAADALDWSVERDGRMADRAHDPEPTTVPWEG